MLMFAAGQIVHCNHCKRAAMKVVNNIYRGDSLRAEDWTYVDGTPVLECSRFGCPHCRNNWDSGELWAAQALLRAGDF